MYIISLLLPYLTATCFSVSFLQPQLYSLKSQSQLGRCVLPAPASQEDSKCRQVCDTQHQDLCYHSDLY